MLSLSAGRFFSGIPHPHLLGDRRSTLLEVVSPPNGASPTNMGRKPWPSLQQEIRRPRLEPLDQFAQRAQINVMLTMPVGAKEQPFMRHSDALKISQAAMNSAAMTGPTTKPLTPKTAMPPRVEKSTT